MTKRSATSRHDHTRRDAKRRRRAARAAKAAGAAALSAGIILHGGQAVAAPASARVHVTVVAATAPSDDPGPGSGEGGSSSEGTGGTEKTEDAAAEKSEDAAGEKSESPSTEKTEGYSSEAEVRSTEKAESPSTTAAGSPEHGDERATTSSETASAAASAPPRPSSTTADGAGPVPPPSILAPGAPTAARRAPATPDPSPVPVKVTGQATRAAESVVPDARDREVAHAVGALVTDLTRRDTQDTVAGTLASALPPSARAADVEQVTRAITDSVLGRVAVALSGVAPNVPLDPAHPGSPAAPTTGLALLQWALFRRGENPLFNQAPRLSPVQDDPTSGALGGSLGAVDPDGDHLTYEVTRQPTHGAVTVDPTTGAYTYSRDPNLDPALAAAGYTDSFQVTVRDNRPDAPGLGGLTAVLHDALARSRPDLADRLFGAHTVSRTVEVVVPATTTYPALDVRPSIDMTRGIVSGRFQVPGREGEPFTWTVVTQPGHGVLDVRPDGTFIYTPNAGEHSKAAATPGADVDTFVVRAEPATTARLFRLAAAAPGDELVFRGSVPILPSTGSPAVVTGLPTGPRPSDVVLTPDGRRGYFRTDDGTLTAIDTTTNATAPIDVGTNPGYPVLAPDGRVVAVTSYDEHTVTLVDTRTDRVIGSHTTTGTPGEIVFSPDGTRVLVNEFDTSTISVIDTATGDLITTVDGGVQRGTVQFAPDGRAYVLGSDRVTFIDPTTGVGTVVPVATGEPMLSADGSLIYVSTSPFPGVVVYDSHTGDRLGQPISVGNVRGYLVPAPEGTRAFFVRQDGTVTVLDPDRDAVFGMALGPTVNVGRFPGVTFSPDGDKAYLTSGENSTMTIVDLSTGATSTVAVGTGVGSLGGLVFSPDGDRLLVTSTRNVTVVDVATGQVVGGPVDVGTEPWPAEFHEGQAWITSGAEGKVTVVDLATGEVVGAPILVGARPTSPTFSLDGRHAYVSNFGDNTVSVIDMASMTVVTTIPEAGGSKPRLTADGRYVWVTQSAYDERAIVLIETATGTYTEPIPAPGTGDLVVPAGGSFAYTTDDYTGTITVIYLPGGSAEGAPVPPAVPPPATTSERGVVSGNLGFTDPDGDPLSYEVVGEPTSGTVTVDESGNYVYTPSRAAQLAAARTAGKDYDTFTVLVADGSSLSQARGFRLLAAAPGKGGTLYTQQVEIPPAATPGELTVERTILVPPGSLRWSPDNRHVYVQGDDGTLTVVDAATGTSSPVPAGAGGFVAGFSRDGQRAYVLNPADGTLTVVDTATQQASAPIAVGASPTGVQFSPDGRYVLVGDAAANRLRVIDASGEVVAVIDTGTPPGEATFSPDGRYVHLVGESTTFVDLTDLSSTTIPGGAGRSSALIGPDGRTAYVLDRAAGTVTVYVDGQMSGDPIVLGPDTGRTGTLSPDGRWLYVLDDVTGTVTPVDLVTRAAHEPVGVGSAPGIVVVDPVKGRAHVLSQQDRTVTIVDPYGGEPVVLPVGSDAYDVLFSADGRRVYVPGSADVTVIDTTGTPRVLEPLVLSENVGSPRLAPDGRHLWVAGPDPGTMLVVDSTDDSRTLVRVGARPGNAVFSPDGSRAYVTGYDDRTVTVIDTTTYESTTVHDVNRSVRISPDGRYAYTFDGVSKTTGRYVLISTIDDHVTVLPVERSSRPVFSPDGHYAYVVDRSDGSLVVIDLGTGLAEGTDEAPEDGASAA